MKRVVTSSILVIQLTLWATSHHEEVFPISELGLRRAVTVKVPQEFLGIDLWPSSLKSAEVGFYRRWEVLENVYKTLLPFEIEPRSVANLLSYLAAR